jgi:hypothetical protein
VSGRRLLISLLALTAGAVSTFVQLASIHNPDVRWPLYLGFAVLLVAAAILETSSYLKERPHLSCRFADRSIYVRLDLSRRPRGDLFS